jgi:HPt (histidine-containing phosphotransfer) domain-containing protein
LGGNRFAPVNVRDRRRRLLVELVEKFASDARVSLEALHRAVRDGDGASLRDVSHSLKGSSRTVGAFRVGNLCEVLEIQGKSNDAAGAHDLLRQLNDALSQAIDELRRAS